MKSWTYRRLGIMADSHGNSKMIAKAIGFLKGHHCDGMIHLGDICDSFRPQTCTACIELLIAHHIPAVKGNNDHVLEINQTAYADSPVSPEILSFLRRLPPVLSQNDAVFAHSLPFFEELGISCITRALGKNEVIKFITMNPKHILFRGHSHSPSIRWQSGPDICRRDLPSGKQIRLDRHLPCVVTCGALTRGLVMIWDTPSRMLTSLSFT